MKKTLIVFLYLLVICCSYEVNPPILRTEPDTLRIHDKIIIDEYAWFKDKTRTDQEIIDFLNQENNYTKAVTRHTGDLQDRLFREMKDRINITDSSVPVRIDSFYYFTRTLKDKQYIQYCRYKENERETEVYLDLNERARSKSFYSVYNVEISPDHRFCAFSYDDTGNEVYSILILDTKSGKFLDGEIENASELTWMEDGRRILYISEDESGRSYRLYCHRVGTDPGQDLMLYEEQDKGFYLWLHKSKNDKHIFLGSVSKTTSEYRFFRADADSISLQLFQTRQKGHRYFPEHHQGRFIIRTDIGNAFNYMVMTCDENSTGIENWQPLIAHNDSTYISIDVFREYLVVLESVNGNESFKIYKLDQNEIHLIDLPGKIYNLKFSSNPDFNSNIFRFKYESFHIPSRIYEYNIVDRSLRMIKQEHLGDGYDPGIYSSTRIFVPVEDVKIPVTLVYNSSLVDPEESNYMLLEAYGAYGDNFDPYFSKSKLSIYDRGIVYGIAHVRGGGFYGTTWHDQGRMLKKKNSFRDFISCSEYLIDNGYTERDKLVIEGGSAGGLLVGVVINSSPQLFKAAVADVPFVDILNTMLDESLSAVVSEYEEWGNPNLKNEFEYIFSYSPYENIRETDYPALLVITAFQDTRVNYWEPVKWVSRIRRKSTDTNPKIIYIDMESGHGGASGRFNYYREIAFKYAFVLDQFGLE